MKEEIIEENINSKVNNSKEIWRLGVLCKENCFDLTQEILNILEDNGYEWKKVTNSYKIKCRKKKVDKEQHNNFSKNNCLNVEIQIYGKIEEFKKDEFLVDLHKKVGSVMEFLHFTSIFIFSLQKKGLVIYE
jgi:hypothetical protein